MAIPASGAISLTTIQTEFGGTDPIGLNEYYAGGANVGSGTSGTNGAVPSSGQIAISNFYGTAAAEFITASGGTIYTSGDYKYHKFTGNGTFTVNTVGNASGSDTIAYLVVAGGGAGGARHGGGGGAGGLSYHTGKAASVGSLTVTIGAGGTFRRSGSNGQSGNRGINSSFWSTTSNGGGGGKSYTDDVASSGGSGGGGGGQANTSAGTATQANTGGATGYGYAGGVGSSSNPDAGGGGGAGAVGGAAPTNQVGGIGRQYSTFATATSSGASGYYAGGGGGGDDGGVAYSGGTGGGGAGGGTGNNGVNGSTNTGGGAGGTRGGSNVNANGGNGGSGIVIISYKYQ